MKLFHLLVPSFVLIASLQTLPIMAVEAPAKDNSEWNIQEIYNYLQVMGDELQEPELSGYCQFIVNCQESERGIFVDKFKNTIYSVKAFHLLKRFGYKPKYPLSVCQYIGKDLHYCLVEGQIISKQSDPELFRKWLDITRDTYNAYAAGSLIGHFIAPHVMNLEMTGKQLEESPFIPDGLITPERIRSLLVKTAGLHALAEQRIKSHVQAEHERKQ